MRDGFIIEFLTSVDIQEIVRLGSKVMKMCEGVIHKRIF